MNYVLLFFLLLIIFYFNIKSIESYDQKNCKQYVSDKNCKSNCDKINDIKPFKDTSPNETITEFIKKITTYTNITLDINKNCNNCMNCLIQKTSENLKNN